MDNMGIKNRPKRMKLEDSSFGIVVEILVFITIIGTTSSLVEYWFGL